MACGKQPLTLRQTRGTLAMAWAVLVACCLGATPLHSGAQAPDAPGWRSFESAEGRFKAVFPGAPIVKRGKLRTDIGDVPSTRNSAGDGDGATYDVTWYDYPPERIARLAPDKLLGAVRDGLVYQSKGRLASEKKFTIGKVAGREAEIIGGDGTRYRIKLMLVGSRLYQLTAMSLPPATADDRKFFGSFQLTGGTRP